MNLGKAERREAKTDKEKAEVSEEKASRLFPEARIFGEGTFQSATGDQVMTLYVDLSGQVGTAGLCLVKATEPQYEIARWFSMFLPGNVSRKCFGLFPSLTHE